MNKATFEDSIHSDFGVWMPLRALFYLLQRFYVNTSHLLNRHGLKTQSKCLLEVLILKGTNASKILLKNLTK